jgi:hypothetical protein
MKHTFTMVLLHHCHYLLCDVVSSYHLYTIGNDMFIIVW